MPRRRGHTRPTPTQPTGTVRVAIYTRRSTDEENQPFTIDAQVTKLKSYIRSQDNWVLVHEFSDDASGAKIDRPDLNQALLAARAGRYDVLLVYRVDRFTRRIRDLSALLEDLDRAGVVFRSATEPFDTSTPAGRMLVQMLGVFAEFEREMIIDRVINGMERKAGRGQWTLSSTPEGYQVDPATAHLSPVDTEIPVITEIFRLYTADRLGCRGIAATINARGLRRRSGRPYSHKTEADLRTLGAHIAAIIRHGDPAQTKALCQIALDTIEINTATCTATPVYRIDIANDGIDGIDTNQPGHDKNAPTGNPIGAHQQNSHPVRERRPRVEPRGLEPLTPTLPVWCATSCATAPNHPVARAPAQ